MLIVPAVAVRISPVLPPGEVVLPVPAVEIDAVVVLHIHAPGSLDRERPGVEPRKRRVQGHGDGLPMGAGDDRRHHVSLGKGHVCGIIRLSLLPQEIVVETCAPGGDRNKTQHPVAPVQIQDVCNGPQLMGRIVLTVAVSVVQEPVVPVLPPVGDLIPKVMPVAALTVDDLPEEPLPDHVQDHELVPAVAAVLQDHALAAGLLVGPHQLPAVLHGIGAADFHGGVLAGPHGLAGIGDVGVPGGGNHHRPDGIHREHVLIALTLCRSSLPGLRDKLCRLISSVRIAVADRGDPDSLGQEHLLQEIVPSLSQSHDADLQFFVVQVDSSL